MKKSNIALIVLFVGLTSTAQYFFGPKRVITKTKEVVKIVEVIDRDIEIIETKDGTKVTKIKERSKKSSESTKLNSREVIPLDKKWLIGVSTSLTDQEYRLDISRRIIGGIYVGAYASTEKEFGVSVSLNF